MRSNPSLRHGFTIIEALVAFILITIALGALEGNAAGTIQKLRDSASESLAARLAQARTESVLAGPCLASNGIDSMGTVAVTWSATTDSDLVQIDQTASYPTAFGFHTETFQTMGECQ
ncbi:MAG TPA: prepilin-type N-terminal cleavage/methylation domain-containing protein [Gemmatimonadaceae bacterium]|jgi:Tfp pilus assembly protein PilV|nr:prepilin-type N-terminal cleavage/methylation domain-containing protein [Gemmatimonadaceae bacterium]